VHYSPKNYACLTLFYSAHAWYSYMLKTQNSVRCRTKSFQIS